MVGADFRDQPFDRRVTAAATDQLNAAAGAEPTVRLTDSLRTETFSDGVLAITITLLTVEIGRPSYEPGRLLAALTEQWPAYLAFVVSFVLVGGVWLNHHALFSRIRLMDRGLQWLNLTILMTAAILPFPTAVLAEAFAGGEATDQRVAVGLYALVAVAISAAWIPMFPYLRDHPHLLEREADAAYFDSRRTRPWTAVVLYAVAGILGAAVPAVGLVLFAVMVVLHALTSGDVAQSPLGRWRRRASQTPGSAQDRSTP